MDDESLQEIAVVRETEELTGNACLDCGEKLCGHQALFSIVLGFKTAPRCLTCFAKRLQQAPSALCDQIADYIQHRDCYRQAWNAASEREGYPPDVKPGCLLRSDVPPESPPPKTAGDNATDGSFAVGGEWDAGDMGCGDLVLALRIRLQKLAPGTILKVVARDPAAPQDLPAWCRLTGHRLIQEMHPEYFIERKGR